MRARRPGRPPIWTQSAGQHAYIHPASIAAAL